MNNFYRTSASNRHFRVEPARPRRHQLGKINRGSRTANRGQSASNRAPAAAGARTKPKAPRRANHARRHISHAPRTEARGQVYAGKINADKVHNNA